MDSFNITADPAVSFEVTLLGLILYLAAFLPLAFGIVFLNGILIYAFFNDFRLRRSPANYYLISLAFADLLTGLVAVPANVFNRLVMSHFTCSSNTRYIIFLPTMLFCGTSMAHLTAIAIDRYIAVSRPARYPTIATRRRVKAVILVLWLGCSFGGLWPIIGGLATIGGSDGGTNVCTDAYYTRGGAQSISQLYSTSAVFAFVVIVTLCYSRILSIGWRHLIHHCRRQPSIDQSGSTAGPINPSQHPESRSASANRPIRRSESIGETKLRNALRFAVTVAIITFFAGVTWTPSSIKTVVFFFRDTSARTRFVTSSACEYILFTSSLVNPLVYGWRSRDFRGSYRKILRGRRTDRVFPLVVYR